MNLIIVESPTKTRHIGHHLGSNFKVVATLGHLYDLPTDELGIDVKGDFSPKWARAKVAAKTAAIKKIKELAQASEKIYVATDPDREGEGIAKHIYDLVLSAKDRKKALRVEFKEITRTGIEIGLMNPRALNENMAMAQHARRIMDRLVGYEVSPMLWGRLKGKGNTTISAGRVQSAALNLIRQKQLEIERFVSQDYWSISGEFKTEEDTTFHAALTHLNGQSISVDEHPISTRKDAENVMSLLTQMEFEVLKLESGEAEYPAPPPLVTTTLLQTASSQLNYPAKKAMKIAQELFEQGFITYMRTDSPRVSLEAQTEARDFISKNFGQDLLPTVPSQHHGKDGAQDAHECIRPTKIANLPDQLKASLTKEQHSLYQMIFWRFLLSQMAPAVCFEVSVQIEGSYRDANATFRSFSSRELKKGWRILDTKRDDKYQAALETLAVGDPVWPVTFAEEQHKTKPPAFFTEASLIKTLERLGIGRPSTYATIVETLLHRSYVVQQSKKLLITDVGCMVVDSLAEIFPVVLDSGFTADMEHSLDLIASGHVDWIEPVRSLYDEICTAKSRV